MNVEPHHTTGQPLSHLRMRYAAHHLRPWGKLSAQPLLHPLRELPDDQRAPRRSTIVTTMQDVDEKLGPTLAEVSEMHQFDLAMG